MPPSMVWRRAPGARPSASCPNTRRTASGSNIAALRASRALPSTPFMEAHYFQNDCFMKPDQLMNEAEKLAGIPGIIVQGRYDLLCPPAISHALAARWPGSEVRVIGGTGHSLYDPGIRDAVMKAIADIASRNQTIERINNAIGRKRHAADVDGYRRHRRSRLQPLVRPRTSRGAGGDRGFLEARRYVAHKANPKYLCLYSTATFEVLDSPAYRASSPTRPIGRSRPWRASRT